MFCLSAKYSRIMIQICAPLKSLKVTEVGWEKVSPSGTCRIEVPSTCSLFEERYPPEQKQTTNDPAFEHGHQLLFLF